MAYSSSKCPGKCGVAAGSTAIMSLDFCFGRDQFLAFRGGDRQSHLLTWTVCISSHVDAVSASRVNRHVSVEQDHCTSLQCHAQGSGWLHAKEVKRNPTRLGRQIDQHVLV